MSPIGKQHAFEVVARVIRDWDPYGLGCPENEFDAEIESVVQQLPQIKSAQDAAHVLSKVFSSAFDGRRSSTNSVLQRARDYLPL